MLGTRRDEGQPRRNPFAPHEIAQRTAASVKPLINPLPARKNIGFNLLIDAASNKDGQIDRGLEEIAAADPQFDVAGFMEGARHAFGAVVRAYNDGDRNSLRALLSPKLYADFDAGIKAREDSGHVATTDIHRIKAAHIVEAHLGGTMAYITVDYDVEQTTVTRDKAGAAIEATPHITNVEDIWTFTRDIRSDDPNWTLIETRAAEK